MSAASASPLESPPPPAEEEGARVGTPSSSSPFAAVEAEEVEPAVEPAAPESGAEGEVADAAEGGDEGETREESEVQQQQDQQKQAMDLDRAEVVRAAIEASARAAAQNLLRVTGSLRATLSEDAQLTLDHLEAHERRAQGVQEAVIEAERDGRALVNACNVLDGEMSSMRDLAAQVKEMRRQVDRLDVAVTRVAKG
jgi:BLOC-1-related complex sub-unit 6 C-terminal helix